MKMLLEGKWTDASDGAVIPSVAPATGQEIDTVPRATREDAQRCLQAARRGAPA